MRYCFRKRLPGFTLWEVLITMMIVSLVGILSYGIFIRFTARVHQEQINNASLDELRQIELVIHKLVNSAERIEEVDGFLYFESPDFFATIDFGNEMVHFENLSDEQEFEIPFSDYAIEFLDDKTDLVTGFNIITSIGMYPYTLSFHKTYSREFLYQYEISSVK